MVSEVFLAQLVVIEGRSMGSTFTVSPGATIGASPESAIRLPGVTSADGPDARIDLREGTFYVCIEPGRGRVEVNGQLVQESPLRHGDMVTIGKTMFLFDQDDRSGSSSAVVPEGGIDEGVVRRRPQYGDATDLLGTFELEGRDEKKLAILYRFCNGLTNIFEVRELGDRMVELLRKVFPAERAVVLLEDDYGRKLMPIATWSRRESSSIPRASRTILREAIRTREGLLTTDAMEDERFLTGQSIVEQNIRSALCVPLVHKDDVLGVAYLDNESSRAFDQADLDLLNGIATVSASAIQNARVYSRRRRNTQNLVALARATQKLSSFLKERPLIKESVILVCNLLSAERCSILLGDKRRTRLRLSYAVGMERELWPAVRIPIGEGLAGHVFATGEPILHPDPENSLPEGLSLSGRDRYQTDSCLIVPIRSKVDSVGAPSETCGVICAADRSSGHPFGANEREILLILANQVGIALHNADLYEKATVDVLTGVQVRRYLFGRMSRLMPVCLEKGIPLSVMMMDLDHFKEKNDTYGHPVGDRILREMGGLIRRSTREQDIAARYGGEEFVIMLYDTPLALARQIGERLRQATEKYVFNRREEPVRITVSIGLALAGKGDTCESVVKRADEALYAAKQAGRNRVEVWGEGVGA